MPGFFVQEKISTGKNSQDFQKFCLFFSRIYFPPGQNTLGAWAKKSRILDYEKSPELPRIFWITNPACKSYHFLAETHFEFEKSVNIFAPSGGSYSEVIFDTSIIEHLWRKLMKFRDVYTKDDGEEKSILSNRE